MRMRIVFVGCLLLLSLQDSVGSGVDRSWHVAQVHGIQRTLTPGGGDHWEYTLISDGLVYILRTTSRDAPYLNSSLNFQIKIASSVSGSDKPFDSDEVYVLDVKGQEHKMVFVSVVSADDT